MLEEVVEARQRAAVGPRAELLDALLVGDGNHLAVNRAVQR